MPDDLVIVNARTLEPLAILCNESQLLDPAIEPAEMDTDEFIAVPRSELPGRRAALRESQSPQEGS